MGKIRVLTVQFDVTGLPQEAIDQLRLAVEAQAVDLDPIYGKTYEADHLRSSDKEVDIDDV